MKKKLNRFFSFRFFFQKELISMIKRAEKRNRQRKREKIKGVKKG